MRIGRGGGKEGWQDKQEEEAEQARLNFITAHCSFLSVCLLDGILTNGEGLTLVGLKDLIQNCLL